jgi:hypothetical protein
MSVTFTVTPWAETQGRIVELFKAGRDVGEIAEALGLGLRRVADEITRAGGEDLWRPLCMDADEYERWRGKEGATSAVVKAGNRRPSKREGWTLPNGKAMRPCHDCLAGYAAEMRAEGRCNGRPMGYAEDDDERIAAWTLPPDQEARARLLVPIATPPAGPPAGSHAIPSSERPSSGVEGGPAAPIEEETVAEAEREKPAHIVSTDLTPPARRVLDVGIGGTEVRGPLGVDGPPCATCAHAVVCSLRMAWEAVPLDLLGIDVPEGLRLRVAVDCEHYLATRAETIREALGAAAGWTDVAAVAAAMDSIPIHLNTGSSEARAMGWSEGYDEGFTDGRADAGPFGGDRGVGSSGEGGDLGPHGSQLPGDSGSNDSGSGAEPDDPSPTIDPAGLAAGEVRRAERTGNARYAPKTIGPGSRMLGVDGLTRRQREVRKTARELGWDISATAARLNIHRSSVGTILLAVAQHGGLPAEAFARLPARFAKYATVPA